jgi:hypothetical protein
MSSDIHSVLVGELWRKAGMVAKASGSAITEGTVNYYLKCLTGANAGKWWKNSDQTWAATETANTMTHQADGGWTITLAATPFVDAILYYEYAKESGDLHVAGEGRLLRGKAVLDSVSIGAILGTVLTETSAGYLAAAMVKLLNVATPLMTVENQPPTAAAITTALLDLTNGIETGTTPRQAIRAIASMLAGIISGGGTGTEVFKGIGLASDGTTRVTVVADANGNRSAVTLNL